MFSKKLSADGFTNLIAPRTTINGSINYDGVLKIQGTVRGDLLAQALDPEQPGNEFTIIVDATGKVHSTEVRAMNAIIKGSVDSDVLWVEDTLRVHKSATLKCVKIYYRTLEIEPGALLHDCQLIHLDHTSKGEQV